nr:hypothetical protein [Tanacetum cinerariifolium]
MNFTGYNRSPLAHHKPPPTNIIMSDETTTVECSEMKLLELAVQDLPPDPLKHLLIHHHVCVRCIFRLFNVHE